MPPIQQQVKPVTVDYLCDNCRKGWYRPLPPTSKHIVTTETGDHKFEHQCNECRHTRFFFERYPVIKFIPIDQTKIDLAKMRE